MVDYNNPVTEAHESAVMLNFWHIVEGIFIWEFFTTLDYELDVIRGRRPYRWTILIYFIARVSTLLSIILNIIGFDSTTPIYCQIWIKLIALFSYVAFASSSLLIVLRIIAVWNMAKIPIVIAMGVWVADVAFIITATVRIRSTWSPEAQSCTLIGLQSTKPAAFGSLIIDVVLLLVMLCGVIRLRFHVVGAFDLGHILWTQGVNWLLLAIIAEVPALVLLSLNLNVPLSLAFQTPAMIIMSIAATRMYRSLIQFASSGSPNTVSQQNGGMPSELRVCSGNVPPGLEVSVHREADQYPMTHIGTDRPAWAQSSSRH